MHICSVMYVCLRSSSLGTCVELREKPGLSTLTFHLICDKLSYFCNCAHQA